MKVGYARVSTDEQNLDMQIQALKDAGAERVFLDQGISGGAVFKPGLVECLQFVRAGDEIIVYKLDRLSRSLRDLIELVELLGKAELLFRSLHEQIETASPAGRLLFHVIGALAEFERDVIRQRTRDGLAAAKRAGKNLGRPPAISDEQWRTACTLLDGPQKMPVSQVAALLNVSRQAIYKRLNKDQAEQDEVERIASLLPSPPSDDVAMLEAEQSRVALIERMKAGAR